MNLLDWLLLVLVLIYALSGYWQGFITGACATVGLICGGVIGIWLAPKILQNAEPSLAVSLGALFVVLVCASFGQAVFQYFGARLREKITWQPVRAVDAAGGAVLSVVAVLVVSWMLGVAISGSRIPGISPLARDSMVLRQVNEVMPAKAQDTLRAFDKVVGSSFFPRYLEPFAPERIINVGPAPATVLQDPDIQRARRSVFKIRGNNVCGSGVEGSGFLYAPGRVMTNAHVVAGVRRPNVIVAGKNVDAQGRLLQPGSRPRGPERRRHRPPDPRVQPRRPTRDRRRRARLPPGRAVRRPAGPHPRAATAPFAGHLRLRHRHP